MRMWMVNPEEMCRKHLLGEHLETHMLLGSFKRNKKLDGFVKNNCLEPKQIFNRHNLLADEMTKRGYKHQSPLNENDFKKFVLQNENYKHMLDTKVFVKMSEEDLFNRCIECRKKKETSK